MGHPWDGGYSPDPDHPGRFVVGVQLGAIGTTYVKDHIIKIVMGTIMLIVAVSRPAVPEYLVDLKLMVLSKEPSAF